jgi:hypothetical protein
MNARVSVLSRFGLLVLGASLAACAVESGGVAPDTQESNTVTSSKEALTLTIVPGVYFDAPSGVITIFGTSGNDTSTVNLSGTTILASLNFSANAYAASSVKAVNFYGFDGADTFTNSTSVPCTLRGGNGDDNLTGGTGADSIFGDAGNDSLHGGDGRDNIFGGPGTDSIFGDAGQDLIVTVGGGADTITGGAQWDNVWMDTSDTFTDMSIDELNLGYLHNISAFQSISYNGGSSWTAIGLEPAGEDLPDPLPDFTKANGTKNISSSPLFASGGPNKDDVLQGQVGDCYYMSPLSANAGANPEAIRKFVAPLGDGTFAVRFFDNGLPVYYRVDGDMWLDNTGTSLLYAEQGTQSAIWVPIVEKAYAFFRRDNSTYASIASGDGKLADQTDALEVGHKWPATLTQQQMDDWAKAGFPAGSVKDQVDAAAQEMLGWINAQRTAGIPVVIGAVSGVTDSTPLRDDDPSTPSNESTWHRGQHIYMVDHVTVDAGGTPVSITLRNPYFGRFGQQTYFTMSDYAHIVYCLSGGDEFKMP